MKEQPETEDDLNNAEAWAGVIGEMLRLVPAKHRAAVLAQAAANEEAHSRRPTIESVGSFVRRLENSPAVQNSDAIERLQSLIVQVFVRSITKQSKQGAAAVLFATHPQGTGSGRLLDYLRDLPQPRKR